MRDQKKWSVCMAAAAMAVLTVVGGVMAYFTDVDTKVNTFTVGSVTVAVQEPTWDAKPDENGNDIPDEAEHMLPMQTISKDPQVENTGTNDAFVFMTVQTPYRNLVTANADGTKNAAQDTALYTYTPGADWTFVGTSYEIDAAGEKTAEKKLYAYAKEGLCRALGAGQTTTALFENVTMANVTEDQQLETQTFEIPIEAYAIQTSNLSLDAATPQAVWNIISNANNLTAVYE